MTTQMTQTQTQLPTNQAPPQQAVFASDILIPRLLLMQGLSPAVAERKAQQGDMRRNTTMELLGGPDSGVEVVPLKLSPAWRVEEFVNGKFTFRRTEPRTAANDTQEWKFTENGTEWRRVKVLNLFALLAKDLESFIAEMEKKDEIPDMSKMLLPVLISFKVKSYKAGKAFSTFYAQIQDMKRYNANVKPYAFKLPLTCKVETNEKGTFYVWDAALKPTKLAEKYLPEAERWYGYVNNMQNLRVTPEEEDGETEDTGNASNLM